MLELELLSSLEACAPLSAQWHQLARQDPEATVFASPTWAQAWLGAFGKGKDVRIATLTRAGQLVAVVPLVAADVKRGPTLHVYHDIQPEDREFLRQARRASLLPLRQIAPLANLQSANARTAMACLPGRQPDAWQALAQGLSRRRDWDVLLLTALPADTVATLQAAAKDAGLKTLLERGPTLFRSRVMRWDDYFKPRHRHFRTRFRSGEQLLDKLGGGTVRVSEGAESLALLERALELAHRSWKQQGRPGEAYHVPMGEPVKRFYRDFAQRHAAEQPMPIFSLEIAGQLRAVLVCAVQGRRIFALQTFYDPEIARVSPGARLLPALFDYSHARGLDLIDWNGNSTWVQRFADSSSAHATVCMLRGSLTGRVLHGIAGMLRAREPTPPADDPQGAGSPEESKA